MTFESEQERRGDRIDAFGLLVVLVFLMMCNCF